MEVKQAIPVRLHVMIACLAVAFLLIFAWVLLREETAEWRTTQARFGRLEATVKNPHQRAQAAHVGGLRQIWLEDLGRVDRCTTCHLGIDDPVFDSAPQPFSTHPGAWLTSHPPDRFGCTVCHGGQGQATDYLAAAHQPRAFEPRPMRPLETIEANCGTCHRALDPPDAPRLVEGRRLIVESGCVSCHEIPGFEGVTFAGPALASIGYKVRPEWLRAWLKDPKGYLSQSKMGNFRLSDSDIASLQAFLLSQRAVAPVENPRVDWSKASVDNGRALFGELRCVSCHAVKGRGGTIGPELTSVGDKLRRAGLFDFLKDPHRSQPDTPMLQYRLTDEQVRDLTEFLLETYRTSETPESASAAYQDARAVALGRAVFEKRGCTSCHRLPGIADSGRVGPSLAGIADRDPDQLSYGKNSVRRTAENYIFLKVLRPDSLGEPSTMPTFSFAPAQAAKIAMALAGIRKADLPASYVQKRQTPSPYKPAGRFGELVDRYRCLSCHSVGGYGGDLSTVPFDRIGSQLKHDYIASYLLNPGAVRVSLEARMPVFHMTPDEATMIADYFSGVFLDDDLERYDAGAFTPQEALRGQELYRQLGCVSCHQIGTTGGYVGPELSRTGERLKPGWIAAFLAAPTRYKPGTLQPDYGLSSTDARALTAYLSSLSAGPVRKSGGAR